VIDEETEEIEEPTPGRPWSWVNAAGAVFNFGANTARSFAALWGDLSDMCCAHAQVAEDRANAIASMHRDLEMLPTTVD